MLLLIVKNAVEYLNPDQAPVLVCDQPLFAIAKEIQWTWPDTFGEIFFVIMLGELHIEMTALKLSDYALMVVDGLKH